MGDDSTASELCATVTGSLELTGRFTEADFLEAFRLARRGRTRFLLVSLLAAGVFGLVLVAMAVSARPSDESSSNKILIFACVLYPAVLSAPYVLSRIRLRRYVKGRPDEIHPLNTTLDDEGFHFTTESTESRIRWDAFSKVRASDRICLLYFKDGSDYVMVGRARFPDQATWAHFLNFTAARFIDF